ncbi:MAG: hypothetical protein UR34_C0001G0015 [candidate division WS6 bacterium GW2011_GWC1_33_20]|uniref:Signal peptidase II n=1 Tax=candidate division WS6 bacterium GW2011_GWC1_33_20 TaxID=1619089 RepID=A0A0F9ZKM3_9BACT|nr:MAG: hypothetical protein UR32_C0003G0060 [candidate division WS6 bacterium GW2011_GWE2_33_157]KKP44669.1 MAG: hypothetical protein UR34_C0001G0015 [candidate division WS6 bacterium GW2011_GWC1_33_20]KKP45990.1 MAG: hypothetical protein UR36_C0002G0032 [candidate division WS6 bacterium GW2011_GWF1_33_233]KKP55578.1 MAG: hypothetical protein UR45_C0001G0060 [candidate division WS6 bacterium GW2011_WS6_33_547]OGC37989.1 MAG: hypothetical protein A2436_01260 [candidate division WS6 bacterium RI
MKKDIYTFSLSVLISLINVFLSVYFFSNNGCVKNRGVAFGIDIIYEEIISFLILSFLIFIGTRVKGIIRYLTFGVVILGFSNFVVRVFLKYICDYINVFNMSLNIADIFIVIYALLIILICIFDKDGKCNRG